MSEAAPVLEAADAHSPASKLASALPALWLVVAAALLVYAAPPLTDHSDTVRDLLAARDCADDGHCIAGGAQASFGHLRSGSLWPATLAALRAMGAPTQSVHWVVIGADAVTVGLAAALAGPLAASALLCGLLVFTREHLVWSPAWMPLIALLTASAWRTARSRGRLGDWAYFGLALAVQIDLHPVGLLFSGSALVLALCTFKATGPALLTLAGIVGAVFALAPEIAWQNGAALYHRSPMAMVAAAAIALVALASGRLRAQSHFSTWLTSTWLASSWGLPASAATVAITGLVIANFLGIADLHPRYFLAGLPPLALLLAHLPQGRAAAITAALAPLTLAAALGPAEIGIGHPWPVVRELAVAVARDQRSWPNHLYRTQAPGCRRLDSAVSVELPSKSQGAMGNQSWQLLDLDPAATPSGAGWRPVASWNQGRRPMQTWLRPFDTWVRRTQGEVCLSSATGSHTCQKLTPGLRPDQPIGAADDAASLATTPKHLRTFPAAVALTPGLDPAQTTVRLAILPSPPGVRRLELLDVPGRRCPWTIQAILGIEATIAGDGFSATLSAHNHSTGSLELVRSWGPGCDDLTEWQFGPPCLWEQEADP